MDESDSENVTEKFLKNISKLVEAADAESEDEDEVRTRLCKGAFKTALIPSYFTIETFSNNNKQL